MGEMGTFYGGLIGKSKDDFGKGEGLFITYLNIYSNSRADLSKAEKVKVNHDEHQNSVEYGDILFTGSSETPDECGMSSVICDKPEKPLYLNSFSFGFRLYGAENFNPLFLKHLMRCSLMRKQIGLTASGVTRFNVSKKRFAKISIPIPSLELQNAIVAVLDKFETMVTDIKEGLPAEIEARQQQYEYYRNRLLTFERKAQ